MEDIYCSNTWAEVDLGQLEDNILAIRAIVPEQVKIMGIVKANAYGHGAVQVGKAMLEYGYHSLGVANLGEAIELREAGIRAPILILGYTPLEMMEKVLAYDLIQTVYSLEMAQELSKVAFFKSKKAVIHIKIDTGMGRIGFQPNEKSLKEIKLICNDMYVEAEGIYTHFATADQDDLSEARKQKKIFDHFLRQLQKEGLFFPICHAANSAAILTLPEAHYNLVRAGIISYGLYPNPQMKKKIKIKSILAFKTVVSYSKSVSAGTKISYGGIYTVPEKTRIATLPVGYADGYHRLLSGKGHVLLRGKKIPIVGQICMDQCMVDLGQIKDVKAGEEVVLIGRQGKEEIIADEVAAKAQTINYEVLCSIGRRVVRKYINQKDKAKVVTK